MLRIKIWFVRSKRTELKEDKTEDVTEVIWNKSIEKYLILLDS